MPKKSRKSVAKRCFLESPAHESNVSVDGLRGPDGSQIVWSAAVTGKRGWRAVQERALGAEVKRKLRTQSCGIACGAWRRPS